MDLIRNPGDKVLNKSSLGDTGLDLESMAANLSTECLTVTFSVPGDLFQPMKYISKSVKNLRSVTVETLCTLLIHSIPARV